MTTAAAYFLAAAGFDHAGPSDDHKREVWRRRATLEIPEFLVELDPAATSTVQIADAILHTFRCKLREQNREAIARIIGPIAKLLNLMNPPTKLERLLFARLGFSLKPIHARILRAVLDLQKKDIAAGYKNILAQMKSGVPYAGMQKHCVFLRQCDLVAITTIKGICFSKRRRAFAKVSLTPHALDLIARADAPASQPQARN